MSDRSKRAALMFVHGFLSIAVLALLAMITGSPFVFPSLGPTAFLFFSAPTSPVASPRNTLCGHAVGLACGYAALVLTGLHASPPAYAMGVDGVRVLCAALSLAGTGAAMILLDVPHPPAGATTLIVSLGVIKLPHHLAVMELAILLLTLIAWAIHRLNGQACPLWAQRP